MQLQPELAAEKRGVNSAHPRVLQIAATLGGGAASLFGGIGSLSGTLIGAVTLTLVLNGMNLLNISANWQPLVTGVIVILAVWVDIVTRRRAEALN